MQEDILDLPALKDPCREVQTFRHHSAMVRITWPTRKVAEVRYLGVLCEAAYDALRAHALKATRTAAALIVRMDSAVALCVSMPRNPQKVYAYSKAPGCIIVPSSQVGQWKAHARDLASAGVMRLVFAPEQSDLAREMADSLASLPPPPTAPEQSTAGKPA